MDHHYAEPHEVMYHTQLSREMLMGADTALLPGDPGRVRSLAEAMGPTVDLTSHREYTSCLTQVQNRPVLVCSTGMGGPSTAICLEELARLGIKRVIRVGTTGSIQEGLELGDVVIIKAAVRLEGTSAHYAPLEFPAVADFELTQLLAYAAPWWKVCPIRWASAAVPIRSGPARNGMTALPAMCSAGSRGV